ncbi:MAG: carboxylesterase family protein [Calditrichaceae bacterium]|nr:carboxylesterase family protein [Calditrichaceae bacterium]MBN2708113.1 carboxylesterase family protein [Calditrichaceae bacterium]RQV94460.1 MAG: carboxylesterase family protein [Calditrichota bacterium]
MKNYIVVFNVLIVLFLLGCKGQDKNKYPIAKVEQGWLSGTTGSDTSIMVFKGVPFAAPPVGELRWRAPQPPPAWEGIRKADEYACNCTQQMYDTFGPWTAEYQPKGEVCEDCLHLNIWTAAKFEGEKRPVMVYIPGGAFTGGSGNVPVYNGEHLAKKGLVVVTINYRVGVMGFLAHPELTKESEQNSSGNYGLLDQVAALEWINKNIASFGGDPDRVTIMGQSAGAMSVNYLTASPLAKGLFVRAIAQSGFYARLGPGANLISAEQNGLKFADSMKVSSIEELRAMPAADLMPPKIEGFRFSPIVDGWFLPKSVDEIFTVGEQNDVVTLTGLVADEGSSGQDYGKVPAEEFINRVKRQAGDHANEILKLYPVSTEAECAESQKAFTRDMSMVAIYLWGKKREKTGKTNLYTYIFVHQQPGDTRERYQTFHSSELPYVFDNLNKSPRPWTQEDQKIAQIMSSYWVNFITTGNPNGEGLPEWPSYSESPEKIMELGDKMEPRLIATQQKFETLKKIFLVDNQ